MGKMLHNEARELLVESYEKTHNAEEIAKIFGVNKYTVYHCLKQSPVRFCASVNGIASAGLRLMDIACNFGDCYNISTDRIQQGKHLCVAQTVSEGRNAGIDECERSKTRQTASAD